MTPDKVKYSFWINRTELNGLRFVKNDEGISESEQIRQAIRDWLRKKGVKKAAPRRASPRRRA